MFFVELWSYNWENEIETRTFRDFENLKSRLILSFLHTKKLFLIRKSRLKVQGKKPNFWW